MEKAYLRRRARSTQEDKWIPSDGIKEDVHNELMSGGSIFTYDTGQVWLLMSLRE